MLLRIIMPGMTPCGYCYPGTALGNRETGQWHMEISSDLKDTRTHLSLSPRGSPLCVVCICRCRFPLTNVHTFVHFLWDIRNYFISSICVMKKSSIKTIEFYQQNLLCSRAGHTRGPHCILRADFLLSCFGHG